MLFIVICMWVAFILGAWICLLNFYLSFLRYPLYKRRGLPKEEYKHISGIPVFGSLVVYFTLKGLHGISGMIPAGITATVMNVIAAVLILIDTGGLHWAFGMIIYQLFRRKK